MSRSFLGLVLLWLGYPEKGVATGEAALAQAERTKHTPSIAMTRTVLIRTLLLLGDHSRARRHIDEQIALMSELNFPFWRGQALVYLGWLRGRLGEVHEGIAIVREGRSIFLGSGGRTWDVLHAAVLSDLLQHENRSDEADELLNEGFRSGRETGEQWFEAEVLRRLARVHAAKGNQTEAERLLLEACAVAKAQSARQWELRAATALAALRLKQRRAIDARNLLEPIVAGIDPVNNPDLIEALAVLETATANG